MYMCACDCMCVGVFVCSRCMRMCLYVRMRVLCNIDISIQAVAKLASHWPQLAGTVAMAWQDKRSKDPLLNAKVFSTGVSISKLIELQALLDPAYETGGKRKRASLSPEDMSEILGGTFTKYGELLQRVTLHTLDGDCFRFMGARWRHLLCAMLGASSKDGPSASISHGWRRRLHSFPPTWSRIRMGVSSPFCVT